MARKPKSEQLLTQQPIPQVFCPNCRGGNPPTATTCQWCDHLLAASIAGSTTLPPKKAQTSLISTLRRFPWWVYIILFLCVCGGLGSLTQGPKEATTGPTASTADSPTAALQTAKAGATLTLSNATPKTGTALATTTALIAQKEATAQGDLGKTGLPTHTSNVVLDVSSILGKPRTDVETMLGVSHKVTLSKSADVLYDPNPNFTGTALEYKAGDYNILIFLDDAEVARGVVAEDSAFFGANHYKADGSDAFLSLFGLKKPQEKAEGYSDQKWAHTSDGLYIYLRSVRGSAELRSLHVWQVDQIGGASGATESQGTPTERVSPAPAQEGNYIASASVDKPSPITPNSMVRVTGKLLKDGKPVAGAIMNLTAHYVSKDTDYNGAKTKGDGTAGQTFSIGRAADGHEVTVDVVFLVDGQTIASTSTAFTPHK